MLTNPPVPYDFCVCVPNVKCVLNVKALVGAFNQEKDLVGAFSVIVKTDCGTDGALPSTSKYHFMCLIIAKVSLQMISKVVRDTARRG